MFPNLLHHLHRKPADEDDEVDDLFCKTFYIESKYEKKFLVYDFWKYTIIFIIFIISR